MHRWLLGLTLVASSFAGTQPATRPKTSAWTQRIQAHANRSLEIARGGTPTVVRVGGLKPGALSSPKLPGRKNGAKSQHLLLTIEDVLGPAVAAAKAKARVPVPAPAPPPELVKVKPRPRVLVLTPKKKKSTKIARKPAVKPTKRSRPSPLKPVKRLIKKALRRVTGRTLVLTPRRKRKSSRRRRRSSFRREPLDRGVYRVSSEFGPRNGRNHNGIDLAAKPGTPIRAPGKATVIEAGWKRGYGYTVVLDHGQGLKTRYAHLQKKPRVRVGHRLRASTTLGRVGATGHATGPHLHFEVTQDGKFVNPREYLRFSGTEQRAD